MQGAGRVQSAKTYPAPSPGREEGTPTPTTVPVGRKGREGKGREGKGRGGKGKA